MTLYLFDYGKFENLARSFDRRLHYRQRNFSIDNNNSSEIQLNSETPSKDEEGDDNVSPITTVCQGHIKKTSNPDRRMSVPQLSRNKSIIKTREQRITSVIGVPHRHHITIAVNDEPVDIIKTTCTGPCLQSCHSNSTMKTKISLPTSGLKNSPYGTVTEFKNPNQFTNIILMTVIYVISTVSIRCIINLYGILNDLTNVQRKISLSLLYFFAAIITLIMSLNCFPKTTKPLRIQIQLIISIVIIIFWLGLHLIPVLQWYLLIFSASLFGLGSSFLWDSHLRILSKLKISSSKKKVNLFNDIISQANILPTTSLIGHSLHIWSSIIIFIILEALSSHIVEVNTNVSMFLPVDQKQKYNTSQFWSNQTAICGINIKGIGPNWKIPDRTTHCLLYICIGLNMISLVLLVFLLDKSRIIRLPSKPIDNDASRPMISGNQTPNTELINPVIINESWIVKMKNNLFMWIRNNSKICVKLWKCRTFRSILPNLFTMGLVEGFFVIDYNQNFVSCYRRPSFIGISMLMFSIGPIVFVNIFPLIAKQQIIEIISSPISRALFLCSSLLLALTKVGYHWSYLLIFFPWIVAFDTFTCFAVFYLSASSLPNNLLDSTVVVQRVLRMIGISLYTLLSGVFGTFTASIFTLLAHIFISPLIILLSSLARYSKN